jgi:hypothetical protein
MSEATSPRDRWFYSAMALALLAVVLAGFTPTFFGRAWFAAGAPLRPGVVMHGVIGSAWVLLFALQAALVAGHRVEWHQRLGLLGALFAAAGIGSRRVAACRGASQAAHVARGRRVAAAGDRALAR